MADLLAKSGKIIGMPGGSTPSNLGTAAYCDCTTTITQGSTDLPTGGAIYTYIDTMITQALTASY